MDNYTEDELNEIEDIEIWCYDCGNEIPTCNGLCGVCNHYVLLKHEEYNIYNPFWKKHFIENGRLIRTATEEEKEKRVCKQAVNFIKTIYVFNKQSKSSIVDMVWLKGHPPDSHKPIKTEKRKITKWVDIFI